MRSFINVILKSFTLLSFLILSACSKHVDTSVSADIIFQGGSILTMNDLQPQAEALAIKDGEIIAVGDLSTIKMQFFGNSTELKNLNGGTLMPGFFDSHSHLASVGMKHALVGLDSPPAGNILSIDDIVAKLSLRLKDNPPKPGQWLVGMSYDHAMLKEKRHPTRFDLDNISQSIPIAVVHFSMHMIVLNSKALELQNITAHSKNPAGGHIHRVRGSNKPNGLLEETAMRGPFLNIIASLGDGSEFFDGKNFIEKGLEIYAKNGFTTVIEAAAIPSQVKALKALAKNKRLKQDVIALQFFEVSPLEDVRKNYSKEYQNNFRVGGGKVVLDGGSPGRTAYLKHPYHVAGDGHEADYRGYPTIKKQQTLNALVGSYYQAQVPIFIHALGDAAVEMSIDAVSYAESKSQKATLATKNRRRTQLIHLQQVDDGQFEQLKDLDVSLSFQIAHNFYFADFHAEQIYGPERTKRLNPVASALKNGLSVSLHHDAPVHPVDQFMLIFSAVNRTGRSGRVWGEDQRIPVLQALKASTINAAYQFHEEHHKGSLEVGKLADLIIIDKNPLLVDKEQLKDIKVLQTFKSGVSIFSSK